MAHLIGKQYLAIVRNWRWWRLTSLKLQFPRYILLYPRYPAYVSAINAKVVPFYAALEELIST